MAKSTKRTQKRITLPAKKFLSLGVIALLMVATVGGVALVGKKQVFSGRAASKCPSIKAFPLSISSKKGISLSWNGIYLAHSYWVYRNDVGITNTITNSYFDTNISCGVKYSYDVKPYFRPDWRGWGGGLIECQQNFVFSYPCSSATPTPTVYRRLTPTVYRKPTITPIKPPTRY